MATPQLAQKCAWCGFYIYADQDTELYNGQDPEYAGWVCHALCNFSTDMQNMSNDSDEPDDSDDRVYLNIDDYNSQIDTTNSSDTTNTSDT